MNKELRELFDQNNIITKKITLKNDIRIIDTGQDRLVIKKRDQELNSLYHYLKSRSFDYFPEIVYKTPHYDIYRHIEDANLPKEERASDIIKLLTLLHSKTTYYKDIDDDTYKELYENIIERIEYLTNYYQDIAEIIEAEEYMSPAHYLFIRNISQLFSALGYCRYQIENWHQIIEEKKRVRIVQIHNNLSLDHYLLEDRPYFISWRLSKKDIPIYDLLKFYKTYYQEFDFCDLFHNYEIHYPLLPEEKHLLFCLISIPDKIDFNNTEFTLCKQVKNFYNYLSTTDKLIQDYFPNHSKTEVKNR